MDSEVLHESFEGSPFTESHISGNVIHNVKLLGSVSRNKRTYSEQAMKDAVRLYENAPAFFDHPTKSELRDRDGVRSVRDLAGKILSPRRSPGEIRGDIQMIDIPENGSVNPKTFLTALVEQMPDMAGFSHRAQGVLKKGADGDVVESLSDVFALELVTEPATSNGLFESLERTLDPQETEMDMKDLTLEGLSKDRPDLVKAIETAINEGAEIKDLRAENTALKDAKELREKADKLEAHKVLAAKVLKEAKLPEQVVTDSFRSQMEAAEDEDAMKVLIEDRQLLAKNLKAKGPRSVETDMDKVLESKGDGEYEEVNDDLVEEFVGLIQ